MTEGAAIATLLKKSTTVERASIDKRDTDSLSKVWINFWSLRASISRRAPSASVARGHSGSYAGTSLQYSTSDLPDIADSSTRSCGPLYQDSVEPDGAPFSHPFIVNDASSQSPWVNDHSSRREPRGPGASIMSQATDYVAVAPAAPGNVEGAAYHSLIGGLRERYRGILMRRTNYVNLLSFVFFTAFYAAILFCQRRAFLGYDIHKSLTYLLPGDGNGGVVTEFRSMLAIHTWLETTVNETWIDPDCGTGVCDIPVEELAYGRFGCQEDCGWREDLLHIFIDLSYKFGTESARTSSLWNICREGLCSRSSVDPVRSPKLQQQSCYFSTAGLFLHAEGNVSAEVYLPLSSKWEFCLVTSSSVLSVAGTITQVPMSKAERERRSAEREGFLGEGPFDTSVEDLAASGPRLGRGGTSGRAVGVNADFTTGNLTSGASINDEPTDAASARFASGAGSVRLQEWGFSRKVSPCRTDCLAMTACLFRCETIWPEAKAELNVMLEEVSVNELTDLCATQVGCDARPELRLPSSAFECRNFGPFLNLLLRGEALVDTGGDPGNTTGGSPPLQGSINVSPYMDAADVAALALLISECHANLEKLESTPLQEAPKCAHGCSLLHAGDFHCDLDCLSVECNYDFADCCEEHVHYSGDHHYHCPSSQPGSLMRLGEQLFRFNFTVPSDMDEGPNITNETSGQGLPSTAYQDSTRWRMAGVTNRIIAGIVIKQHRTPLEVVPPNKKFSSLFKLAFGAGGQAKPFGANPRFLRESSLYVPELVNRTREFFTPDQLTKQDVPLGFFPLHHHGRDIFPIFIDMSKSQEEALLWVEYLREGSFLDTATEEVQVEIVTYNGILEYFGLLVVRFQRQPGGVVLISSTVQMFSLDMYNTPAECVRGVGEALLVLMVMAGTLSELQQMLACAVKTGSLYNYFANVANLIDLTSITLFYVCIALWISFLVKYHGGFDIQLSYQPYRTQFETDGERLAKMLELANNGTGMLELIDAFEEVEDISRMVDMYSFLTALNLLFTMFRILKLTDFHPRLGIVTHTLARALNDITHYLLVAGVVFISFATMAHLSFGTSLAEFSTLRNSFNTCFLMVVGEVNINDKLIAMQGLQLSMAWIFFWLFMIIMNLILINFFIAFIIDSFSEHMSSGARSSTTIAHDMRDIIRDAVRQFWSLLTCNRRYGRNDATIAAKIDALAMLTADPGTATANNPGSIQPSHGQMGRGSSRDVGGTSEPHGQVGSRGARSMNGISEAFIFSMDEEGGDRVAAWEWNTPNGDHGNEQLRHGAAAGADDKARLEPHVGGDRRGHRSDSGRDLHGRRGSSAGGAGDPPVGDSAGRLKASASGLLSLFLPGSWCLRMHARRRQHGAEERHVTIQGASFTEDEIAKLLLDRLQVATLARGAQGERCVGGGRVTACGEDPVANADLAKAQKVLFGREPAQVARGEQLGGRTGKGNDRDDMSKGPLNRAGFASVADNGISTRRKPRGMQAGDDEVDVESSQHNKHTEHSALAPAMGPARGIISAATCHDVAREISSHAIWRFGTTGADDAGKDSVKREATGTLESMAHALEPAMPENPTVQVAQMLGGLQAQMVEMESRWSASMADMQAHLTATLGAMEARWTAQLLQLAQPGGAPQQHVSSSTRHGRAPESEPEGSNSQDEDHCGD